MTCFIPVERFTLTEKDLLPDSKSIFLRTSFSLNRVLPVISWFLRIFTGPYLGTSYFGQPSVLQKQVVLDTALSRELLTDPNSNEFILTKVLFFSFLYSQMHDNFKGRI